MHIFKKSTIKHCKSNVWQNATIVHDIHKIQSQLFINNIVLWSNLKSSIRKPTQVIQNPLTLIALIAENNFINCQLQSTQILPF